MESAGESFLWRVIEDSRGVRMPRAVRGFVRDAGLTQEWVDAGSSEDRERTKTRVLQMVDSLERHFGVVSGIARPGTSETDWPFIAPEVHADASFRREEVLVELRAGPPRQRIVTDFQVGDEPNSWSDFAETLLREYEPLQRRVLWAVGRIGRAKSMSLLTWHYDMEYSAKWMKLRDAARSREEPDPPYDPPRGLFPGEKLTRKDFVAPAELESFLLQLQEKEVEDGEYGVLRYRSHVQGKPQLLEFRHGFWNSELPAWGKHANPLSEIKFAAEDLRDQIGLREEEAVAFLLCNERRLPWLDLQIRLDNSRRGPRIALGIGSPLVPVDQVTKWYGKARAYALEQLFSTQTYAGMAFQESFSEWLERQTEERPQPAASQSTLLIEFVEGYRSGGAAWRVIWEEWNRFIPCASYSSVQVMRASYFRAKRRSVDNGGQIVGP